MKISEKMTIAQFRQCPQLAEVEKHIFYWGMEPNLQLEDTPFEQLRANGWNITGALKGLNRLVQQAEKGRCRYSVYSEQEVAAEPDKKDVSLIYFSNTVGVPSDEKPFVIICSGGGYTAVCNFTEGFPTAARLNELGYEVFCLTYRVGIYQLYPRPLEDMAAALRFLLSDRESFHLNKEYILCGFSAGGTLLGAWGTLTQGYAAYGLPRPKAMIPVYGLFSGDIPEYCEGLYDCLAVMTGKEDTIVQTRQYNPMLLMHSDYPPCYLVCGKNDGTVNPANSEQLFAALRKQGIPAVLDETEQADHGFGDGTGTTAAGWIDRAAAFAEKL